jgi:flagellar basal body P-ring formation protein FlgA
MPRSYAWIPVVALLWLAVVPARGAGQQSGEPVAARSLARGVTLGAMDIRYPEGGSGGEAAGARVGPGWVTRRVIAEGEPLREPAVGRPLLIRAGEEVEAVWRSGAIELRIRGRAMGGAAEGERVIVRIDTRRRLEGIAVAAGQVRINGENQ